jgi:hypothetical protein
MNWLYFKIILVQASCFQLFLNLNYLEEKYWTILVFTLLNDDDSAVIGELTQNR